MGYLILALSFFGVILGNRPFAKLRLAHLYVFDWVALAWLLGNVTKIKKNNIVEFVKVNKWIVLYFLYGSFLLVLDLFSKDFGTTPFSRIAQHSIIFVYPLIWVFIGFQSLKINSKSTDNVVISIIASFFISHILRIFFDGALEFSIGLVIIVFAIYFLSKEEHQEKVKGILLLPVLYFPIWQMWESYMSRTILLEILLSVIILPFVLFRKSYKRSLVISLGMLFVLLLGFVAISEFNHRGQGALANNVQLDFFRSNLHGEDVETESAHVASPGEHTFHARFRSFVWKTTISDWLEHPILGVGFIPEIPSALEPGFKNQGGYYHEIGAPPVSGAHNSYLTILARMGPIGLGLLFLALGTWIRKMYSRKSLLDACLLVIPLFALFSALFNIGIEAPQSSVVMWFCYGVGMAL